MNFPDPTLPPIVIVDDSQDDAFLLRYRLRMGEVPNPVVTFESTAAALEYLRATYVIGTPPHLMFTDIRMPGGPNGFDLIGTVRANPLYDEMKVVVVTYSNDPADLKRAIELKVDGYLLKFPDADTLGDFVRNGPFFELSRPALRPMPAPELLLPLAAQPLCA